MANEILQLVISELEKVWEETNELKSDLNSICDTSWSILKPPGRYSEGTFKKEEKSSEDQPKALSLSPSAVSEDLLKDVSQLISYGQQVRKMNEATSKPILTKKNQNLSKINSTQPITKSKCSSRDISSNKIVGISKPSSSKPIHRGCQTKMSQTSSMSNICHQYQGLHLNKSKNLESEVDKPEVSTNTRQFDETRFVHKCSLTFSETLKTIKMPKDLRYLLKQYYSYQEKKCRTTSLEHLKITHNFEDRVCKLARVRLEYGMSTNSKLPHRFTKYVEITDRETRRNKTAISGEATSNLKQCNEKTLNTLILQQEKYQQLMELQLQQRLFDVLLASLD